jgi:hypothetical protein
MEKRDVEELKDRVSCAAVLETAGFAVDLRESTRRAVKYRRGDDIVIVIHAGKGWFDPLSDAKGDVFLLVRHLDCLPFAEALGRVADLIGFEPTTPVWTRKQPDRDLDATVPDRWCRRRRPWHGSATWRYLRDDRCIPETVLRAAVGQDRLREGPHGSMWAAHLDEDGVVGGWEERGPNWRGFATGGAKVLFRLGPTDASRICITEAAIDALSLAVIEDMPADSLFVSTGGGWAPATEAAIRALAAKPSAVIVAATDNNAQGEVYAARLKRIATEMACAYRRLRPVADDWNEDLRAMKERRKMEGEKAGLPHARRSRQG